MWWELLLKTTADEQCKHFLQHNKPVPTSGALYLLFSLQIAEWLTSHIILASSLTVSDIYRHVACFPSVRYEKTPPRKAGTLPTAPSPAARPVPST